MTKSRGGPTVLTVLALILFMGSVAGCSVFQTSRPIMPVREYEKLIVGRLDADYVGDQACLSKCHAHDQVKKWFDASTMGAQLSAVSGLPLVNCESCHGPGSLAVDGVKEVDGVQTCDYETFIDLENLPKQAQSLICLKCHSGNATFNMHDWNAGTHNMSGVSCFDCHQTHKGPDLLVSHDEVDELCYECHLPIKARHSLPSRHPVNEGRVACIDCHSPHGTANEYQLIEATVKEVCTNCHGEKEGPFAFEHADVTEDCRNCHLPHGSVNNNLLQARVPFLCLQCHQPPDFRHSVGSVPPDQTRLTRCTDCHSEIHGSDTPGLFVPGGTFTR